MRKILYSKWRWIFGPFIQQNFLPITEIFRFFQKKKSDWVEASEFAPATRAPPMGGSWGLSVSPTFCAISLIEDSRASANPDTTKSRVFSTLTLNWPNNYSYDVIKTYDVLTCDREIWYVLTFDDFLESRLMIFWSSPNFLQNFQAQECAAVLKRNL